MGLVSGTLAAVLVAFLSEDAFGSASTGFLHIGGQGASFAAAGAAFVVDLVVSVGVTLRHRSPSRSPTLRGLVYSETPKEDLARRARGPLVAGARPSWPGVSLVMVIVLNVIFR